MYRYPVPWDLWQLRQSTLTFLFRGSVTFSPMGCELCFSQSWQVPHSSTIEAWLIRFTLSEAWGRWQVVQLPSWTGWWVNAPFSGLPYAAACSCFALAASFACQSMVS